MKRHCSRRDVLRLGGGALGAGLVAVPSLLPPTRAQEVPQPTLPPAPEPTPTPLPTLPRVNGAINIQPLRKLQPGDPGPDIVPALVDLQMRALYELGFEWVRVTISFSRFGPDFLAAIPYVRAARALGINVLGLMADFSGFDLVQALVRRPAREQVVGAYVGIFDTEVAPASPAIPAPGRFALQILNEPTHALGIAPDSYVRDFLSPTYSSFKARAGELTLVAAAEVGTPEGYLRTRAMLEIGLERVCDGVAYHVYDPKVIPLFAGIAEKPVWVTESGIRGPENHLSWVTEVFPRIRTIGNVEQVFYFDLYDGAAHGFRLIDVVPDGFGGFAAVAESQALVGYLLSRVEKTTGGLPHAGYRDLVPDITAYFPTDADREIIASSVFGSS
jgi:hypothetical protein